MKNSFLLSCVCRAICVYVARTVFHDRQVGLDNHLPRAVLLCLPEPVCNHNRRTVAGCLHGRLTPSWVLQWLRTEVSLTPLSVIAHPPVAIRRSGCISQVARPAQATTGTYLLLGIQFSMSRRFDSPGSKGEIVLLYHTGTLLSRGHQDFLYIFLLTTIF